MFDQSELQDVYDHAGRTSTLLGDSDRARCHSRFHQVLADLRARSIVRPGGLSALSSRPKGSRQAKGR